MSTSQDKNGPTSEAYWDKYGIPRVPLSEGLWQLELTIKSNQLRSVICFISEAGEGKSQGVHGLARKYNRRVVDVRTAQFSLIGAGVPQRADEETGMFRIAVPDDYPKPGEKAIMVFDEFNQGQSHAIAMCFKLLEDRGIYNYRLPDDCIIVIMMNPSTANYNVTKIETNPAINRRLKKFYVYNTFSDWKKYAATKDFHYTDFPKEGGKPCHPWVLKFLNTTPNLLYTQKDRDGYKQFACPATWQTISLDLYNLEAVGEALTSDRTETRVAATINPVNARALVEYIRNNEMRVSPDEILGVVKNESGKWVESKVKYAKNSPLRKRILELQTQPGGDYVKLVETVAHYIFDEKPEPDAIAPQLARFWADMPDEQGQAFYTHLSTAAQGSGGKTSSENIEYMQKLTVALQAEPVWQEINDRINSSRDSFERGLKEHDATPDPLDD